MTFLEEGIKNLSSFSSEAMVEELERREKEKREVPEILNDPDYPQLVRCLELFIKRMNDSSFGRLDEKKETKSIAEATIEILLGRNHWAWINKRWE